jgi:hypothetical protein
MGIPNTARLAAPVLLAALLLPACSSSSDNTDADADADTGAAASTSAAPRSPDPSPSPALSPSGTPTPTQTEAEPLPLPAEDGRNLDACRQADCEVYVEASGLIPLAPRFGVSDFAVDVQDSTVTFIVKRRELKDVAGYLVGTGYLSLTNGVTMTVDSISETGAVLRFEPRATDPDDALVGGEGSMLFD